jgi:hypothetical protein
MGEPPGSSIAEGERAPGERWWGRATRLFGAAEALCEANTWRLLSDSLIDRDRCVAVARARLGEAAFVAAWEEGRALSLDQAVAYALEERASPDDAHL